MYKVVQYYEHNGKVNYHIFCEENNFASAYIEMYELYKTFESCMVVACGFSKEDIEYIVLNKIDKGKMLITIEKEG